MAKRCLRRCFVLDVSTITTDEREQPSKKPRGRRPHDLYSNDDLGRLGYALVVTAAQVLSDGGDVARLTPRWIERHVGPPASIETPRGRRARKRPTKQRLTPSANESTTHESLDRA
jgi:hypothetical protein